MEDDGLIIRREIESAPPKAVEYSLSPLGETLRPILIEMQNWGNYYKGQMGMGNSKTV